MVLLKKLLNNLTFHSPAILSEEEGKQHPKELEVLILLGILKQDTFPQERWCPSCENEFVPIQIVSKNRAFSLCTMNEEAGRDYFDPQNLKVWQFDILRFLGLIAKELKINGEIKNVVANDLWQVGSIKKDNRHFLVFYSRIDDLHTYTDFFDAFKSPIKNFVVFTNTETPLFQNAIPIAEIVEVKNKLLVWNTKLFQKYLLNALRQPKVKTIFTKILIKDARLDEQNYLLEINNGEKVISFKSKKKIKELDFEEDLTQEEKEQLGRETLKTKQWKILYHLWDFRWELKDGRVLKKGDYTSLDNLVRGSGSESTEAAYKHIQRLNNRFKNEGVAIEIKGENEKYRLIINKA